MEMEKTSRLPSRPLSPAASSMSSDGKADNMAVLRTEARFKQHWD